MSPEELAAVGRVIRLGKLVRRYDARASWTGKALYSLATQAEAANLYREAEAHLVEMFPELAELIQGPVDD